MRKLLVLALAAPLLTAGCLSMTSGRVSHSCSDAPDPAECVRDAQARVERAENREVRRQIEHRTKRQDEHVHYPEDEDWPNLH